MAIANVEMTPTQMKYIDDRTRELLIEGSAGSGKGLSLDELIPTPTGWTTMGHLQVGDELFDENGNICHVTYKSPIHNIQCYKLTFENGFSLTVDKDHRWKCQTGNYTQNRVWTTEEMFLYLEKQNRKTPRGFIIDMAEPLQLPKKDLMTSGFGQRRMFRRTFDSAGSAEGLQCPQTDFVQCRIHRRAGRAFE